MVAEVEHGDHAGRLRDPVGAGDGGVVVGDHRVADRGRAVELWVTVRPAPTVDRRGGMLRVESFNQSSIDPALLWPEAAFQLWQASYDTLVTTSGPAGTADR
jgi:hypothetical protein